MTPEALVGLLAEPVRLRVFSAVVLGARTTAEVVERSGVTLREAVEALRRLADGGLVTAGPSLTAQLDELKHAARSRASARPAESLDPDRARDAVLRTFLVDGRLVAIPMVKSKRRIVLEHLVTVFEPGVRYPEKEVNAILRAWHPDHAALRRYLVEELLLAREDGVYWRIGGPVDLGP
jgi:hypothetical protein